MSEHKDKGQGQRSNREKFEPGHQKLLSIDLSEQSTLKSNKSNKKSGIKFNRQSFIMQSFGNFDEKYVVLQKLGEGSFGEVFKVQYRKLACLRALKVIRKSESWAKNNTYEQLEILKKLDHPNALKIYEYFETQSQWLIITEYFEGRELFDEIIEGKRLSEKRAAIIFKEICKALSYIHSRQIVHRDIKPENILVKRITDSKSKSDYIVKLIDWGLSSKINRQLSRKCGTPQYCAPEVIKGDYDYRCDLWSLGILLYVMLSGRFPFKGECVGETIARVARGIFSFKGQQWSKISLEAKELISGLLQLNPTNRLQAKDCLKHPWILNAIEDKQNIEQGDKKENQLAQTLMRLKDLTIQNKFTSVVLNFIQNYLVMEESSSKLKEHFEALDQNHDGVLSYEELLQGYSKIYGPVEAQKIVENIFARIDIDGSGQIQYSQFLTFAGKLTQSFTLQHLEEAFKLFDRDGNGRINRSEIGSLLTYEKGSYSQQFDRIIQQIDLDGNGSIDFEQFVATINKAISHYCPQTVPDQANRTWTKDRLRKRKHTIDYGESKQQASNNKKSTNKQRQSSKSKSKRKNSRQKSTTKAHSAQKSENMKIR